MQSRVAMMVGPCPSSAHASPCQSHQGTESWYLLSRVGAVGSVRRQASGHVCLFLWLHYCSELLRQWVGGRHGRLPCCSFGKHGSRLKLFVQMRHGGDFPTSPKIGTWPFVPMYPCTHVYDMERAGDGARELFLGIKHANTLLDKLPLSTHSRPY